MESLSDLFVRLFADTAEFKKPMADAANQLSEFGKLASEMGHALGESFKNFGENIADFLEHPLQSAGAAAKSMVETLGPVGVAAGVAAAGFAEMGHEIFKLVEEEGAAAKATENLSYRLNLTFEETKKLSEMAQVAGVDLGTMGRVSMRLADALQDPAGAGKKVAAALEEMGIWASSSGDALLQLLKKLADIPDATERINKAHEVMGKGAVQLEPLLRNYESLSKAIEDLGGQLDSQGVAKLIKAEEASKLLGIAWDHVKESLASTFAPAVTAGLELMARLLAGVPSPTLEKQIASVTEEIKRMEEEATRGTIAVTSMMGGGMTSMANTAGAIAQKKALLDMLEAQQAAIARSKEYNSALDESNARAKKWALEADDRAKAYAKDLAETAKEFSKAFSTLGMADVPLAIKAIEDAYALLARSGKLSVDQLAVAHVALNTKLQELSDKLPDVTVGYLAFGNAGTLANGSLQKMIDAVADWNNHGTVFGKQLAYDSENLADLTRSTVLAKNGMTDLQMAMEILGKVVVDTSLIEISYGKQVQGGILETAAILRSAGITSQVELRKKVDELTAAYQRMQELQASGSATQHDVDEMELQNLKDRIEANDHLTEAEKNHYERLKLTLDPLHALDTAWKELGADLKRVTNDMSRGLADAIVQGKNLGDVFKKVGQDILSTVLNVIIKQGLKVLIDELANVGGMIGKIGVLFGGIPSGGGGLGGGGGAVSDIAGGAGAIPGVVDWATSGGSAAASAGGGVASEASGIMSGTLGAVLGFANLGVSIASGIVQGIQGAHLNNLMGEIEISVRQIANIVGLNGGESIFGYTKLGWQSLEVMIRELSDLHNDNVAILSTLQGSGGRGNTINIVVNAPSSDPAKMAQEIVKKLKTLSPAFA